MSEYQYYEFCQIYAPLTAEARTVMKDLSSRAKVGAHNASYVYHYGDFRGNVEQLVRDYFDIFFYISNWGTVQLILKYVQHAIVPSDLVAYALPEVISCEQHDNQWLLSVCINNENPRDWLDGEGILPTLLPLHREIQQKRYDFLSLVQAVHAAITGQGRIALSAIQADPLSTAQRAFLSLVDAGI